MLMTPKVPANSISRLSLVALMTLLLALFQAKQVMPKIDFDRRKVERSEKMYLQLQLKHRLQRNRIKRQLKWLGHFSDLRLHKPAKSWEWRGWNKVELQILKYCSIFVVLGILGHENTVNILWIHAQKWKYLSCRDSKEETNQKVRWLFTLP